MRAALSSRRAAAAAVVFLALLGAVRIATTYRVFSQTIDEGTHVAAGFEWLARGQYTLDIEHPPLARILFAADAWLGGARSDEPDRTLLGNELFYRDGRYRRNLAGARAGNLPFFFLGIAAVYLWAARLSGRGAGFIAAALFSALPPILAHAGLTTTDMAAAATLVAALYCFTLWRDEPSWRRTLLLGGAIGLGLVSKLSFLMFFPLGAVLLILPRLGRLREVAKLSAAAAIALLIVAAVYRFESGPIDSIRFAHMPAGSHAETALRYRQVPGYEWVRPDLVARFRAYAEDAHRRGKTFIDFCDWAKAAGYPSPLAGRYGNTLAGAPPLPPISAAERIGEPFRRFEHWFGANVPIPAITFFAGVDYVRKHSRLGHPGYLFGEYRTEGWWYYFPVVLFFKTPLPFLLLAIAGCVMLVRRREPLPLVALALLAVAMTSRINIGVRHILPIFPLLTIAAAVAVVTYWPRRRTIVALLLAWYFVATAIAHPDYLPYFNEAAGPHPERIAADSNLDWGQDLLRLEQYAKREHLEPLYVSYWGWARVKEHLPGSLELPHAQCVTGWIAISEMHPILNRAHAFDWLKKHEPVRRIGASIRLYSIPEGACGPTPDPQGQH
jgi:4-amino-4-deoxy-L-arabinose transferase-like glycosyltransferase